MSDPRFAQQRITACWNMASTSYNGQPGHGLRNERERAAWLVMLRDVLPADASDVLDVGTGTGFLAFRAQELGHRVRGIDLSQEMLAVARGAAEGMRDAPAFAIGDAMAPEFAPASFDVVMNRHLLWTLTDPTQAFRNWRELLRPDGRLVVIDGIWGDDEDDEDDEEEHPGAEYYTDEVLAALPITDVRSVEEVIRMLESAGFGAVREIDLSGIDEAEGHLESTRGRYGLVAGR